MPKKHQHLILVTDIETDGPQIFRHSMRSVASVAICPETLQILDNFSINLQPLPEATEHKETVEDFFKAQFPDAWADLNVNPQNPAIAMHQYMDWLDSLNCENIHFCATPISFDKAWVVWYLQEFCGERLPLNPNTPFTLGDFEVNSWQCGLLGASPHEKALLKFPEEWESPLPHTHIARDDTAHAADELLRRFKWVNERLPVYNTLFGNKNNKA